MHKDLFVAILIICLVVLVCVLTSLQLNSYTCEKAWSKSGMVAEWQFSSGCMLQLPNKTWVPAKSWRTM